MKRYDRYDRGYGATRRPSPRGYDPAFRYDRNFRGARYGADFASRGGYDREVRNPGLGYAHNYRGTGFRKPNRYDSYGTLRQRGYPERDYIPWLPWLPGPSR